jgi:hypothetical protein
VVAYGRTGSKWGGELCNLVGDRLARTERWVEGLDQVILASPDVHKGNPV